MVELFVAGNPVGTLADAGKVLAQVIATHQTVGFRDATGAVIGAFVPAPALTPAAPLVPWNPAITAEELDRRAAEPGCSIDDVRKRLGWAQRSS